MVNKIVFGEQLFPIPHGNIAKKLRSNWNTPLKKGKYADLCVDKVHLVGVGA